MTRPAQRVSLNISDNWDEHPALLRPVAWTTASNPDPCISFTATVDEHQWSIRLNNFPDEPAFTLLVDGGEVIHLDEWPKIWGDMPHFPKGDSPNANLESASNGLCAVRSSVAGDRERAVRSTRAAEAVAGSRRMSRRPKTPTPPSSLYEDAYRWQQGEFYPEHHQANVQRLHQKYPGLSLSEIDVIYRQACRIDFEVQERVGTSQLSAGARQELLDWLEDHFHGFSGESFSEAIERAESR